MIEVEVSFDLAKKLKEKGFPQYTEKSYFVGDHKKRMCSVGTFLHVHTQNTEHLIAAPTIYQVLKWLREEKKIYLELIIVGAEYMCNIYKIEPRPVEWVGSTDFSETYEEAVIAGITWALDNLI